MLYLMLSSGGQFVRRNLFTIGRFLLFVLLGIAVVFGCTNVDRKEKATAVIIDSAKKVTSVDLVVPEDNDCVFDTSTYKFTTQALKKYKPNVKFTWDDIEKEAKATLAGGDTLILHIGGCNHFSYSATLLTEIPFSETKMLIEKSRWLAKTFFDGGFDTKYDSAISKGLFKQTEGLEKEDLKSFEIIDLDTTATNMIYEGFQFQKLDKRTKIVISGYIN